MEKWGDLRGTYNSTSTLDSLTFLDETIGTEQHNTDLAGLQVQAHTLDTGSELDELLSLDIGKTVDTGDTVTVKNECRCSESELATDREGSLPNGQNTSGLGHRGLLLNTTDALLEDRGDLGGGGLGLTSIGAGMVDNRGGSLAGLYRIVSRRGNRGQ